MTQEESPRKRRRPSGDEGAACTKWIVDEVKRRRAGLDWSAERLAEEMTAAGVPWTRDVVVNLENGRRNTLAVHELLALAWVFDAANPVDLLVPPGHAETDFFPVTPETEAAPAQVRAWFISSSSLRSMTGQAQAAFESFRQAVARAESDSHYGDMADVHAALAAMEEKMPFRATKVDADGGL